MSARPPLGHLAALLLLVVVTRPAHAETAASAAPETGAVAPLIEADGPVTAGAPVAPLPTAAPVAPPPSRALVEARSAERPKGLRLAHRWWFWTGLGAAAVGAVLAGLFLGPRQPYTGTAGLQQVF